MFQLKRAISDWRKKLAAQGIKSRKILDELESHLREDVESQIRSGMNPEEAFRAAVRRIGEGPILKTEFAKLPASPQSWLPRLFRIACFVSAPFMLATSAWALLDFEEGVGAKLFTLSVISCLGCFFFSLPFWYRSLPNPYRPRVGITLKITSLLMSCIPLFALLDASGVLHLPGSTAVAMIVWSLLATYLGIVLAYMCLDFERGFGWGLLDCPPAEKFTGLAQRAIDLSHDEAACLRHDFVGTEHLLLGILESQSGLLLDLFRKWNIDTDTIRAGIDKLIARGVARKSALDLPYTPRAKKALALSMQEAGEMGHSLITPEHILLGLLLEREGVAGLVLRNLSLNAQRARRDILDGMGPGGEDGAQPVFA